MNVRAPSHDQLGQTEIFRWCTELLPVHQIPGHASGFGTDRPVELASAQAMKEPAVHRPESKHPDGACVAVWQDGLRPIVLADLLEPGCYGTQRFVPGDPLKGFIFLTALQRTLGNAGFSAKRIEDALRRVDAVEILRDFAAKKSLRDRLRGIALHFHGSPGDVYGYEHGTTIGAVMRADGVHHAKWGSCGRCRHGLIVS